MPVIYQLDAIECGIACLAMVLEFFGRRGALPAVRQLCDPGRDGLNLDELTRAARRLGLQATAQTMRNADDLRSRALQAIVHWRRNHYVVLEEIRQDAFAIIDPARGRQVLTKAEFARAASGAYLTCVLDRPEVGAASDSSVASETFDLTHVLDACEPWDTSGARRASSSTRALPFLVDLIRSAGTWRTLWLLAGYSLALQFVGLVTPLLTQVVVDTIIPGKFSTPLTWLAAAIVVIICAQTVLWYARASALTRLQATLDTALMTRFVSHLLNLPLRFFQHRSSGDLLMRLAATTNVRELITGHSLAVVFDGLFVSGYLFLLLLWSPLFAGIALALGLLQAAILLFTRRAMKDLTDRQLIAQAETHRPLVEALHGIATIKASGTELYTVKCWSTLFNTEMDLSKQRQLLTGAFESGLTSLKLFSTLAFLWCGAHEVLLGHLTMGTMLGLNALAAGFLLPIGSLIGSLQQVPLVRAELARILDVLDTPPEQPDAQPRNQQRTPIALMGAIVFDQVSFRYHASAPLVLTDVSFAIGPGQLVAVVGCTGSGKSTLARLLLGLHEPTRGAIAIDGRPLTSLDYRALRRQCGVVCQDSLVFTMSIRDNIALGRPDLAFESIVRAARLAHIHDEIMEMPMGYDTSVLDAGSGLSAGQRQRVLLARALAHQPAVLLLDEATSHLDTDTERRISRSILGLPCTRLLITHHLSTIRRADTIIVLDAGRVIEMGTHAQLLARGGTYADWIDRGSRAWDRATGMRDEFPGRGIALTDRGG